MAANSATIGAVSIETPAWVRDAVFYQVFPDRFARSGRVPAPGPLQAWDAPPTQDGLKGGDLPGLTDRLDDLAELGITALYLTPIFTSASNHRYHTDDYLAVDPLLGGEAAWRELIETVHGRGWHVILDGVFNHTGRGFLPFHHILETAADSPYLDWYHVDRGRLESGGVLDAYPPPWSDAAHGGDIGRLGYVGMVGPACPAQADHGNPVVREYVMSVGEHWLRAGADGWRLDVPGGDPRAGLLAGVPPTGQGRRADAYVLRRDLAASARAAARRRVRCGHGLPLTEALLGFCGGSHLDMGVVRSQNEYAAHVQPMDGAAFAAELERLLGLYDPAVIAVQFNLLGSHDTPRFVTVCGGDRVGLRLATLIQMTLPGAPSIYYGDEIGMEGGVDPANRGAFPPTAPPGTRTCAASSPARSRCAIPVPRCATGARSGWWGRLVAVWRSCGTMRPRARCGSWPSMPGMTVSRWTSTLPELGERGLEVVALAIVARLVGGFGRGHGGGAAHVSLGPRSGLIARAR